MMQRSDNKSRDWNAYVRSVFLRYVADHPATFQTAYFPPFFQRELDLSDCYGYLRRMHRQGYVKKGENGCLNLTDKGRQAIREDDLRLFDLADPYVSVTEYDRKKKDGASFEETAVALLLGKLPQMKEDDNFIAVRDIHLDVAALLERSGQADAAMEHYLTALYYDVSGLDCYEKLTGYVHGRVKRSAAKEAYRGLTVRPEIADGLRRLAEHFRPETVEAIFRAEPIAITMLSRRDLIALAEDLCHGTYDYNTWQNRGEKAYGKMLEQADRFRKEK